jgi:hypothetical protein
VHNNTVTNPDPLVNPVDDNRKIQIKYKQVENHPDDTMYPFNDDQLSVCR